MIRIQLFGNTNPDYHGILDDLNQLLELQGIELVDCETPFPPIYLFVKWQSLFKQMVKKFPEFKADDAKRKQLKSVLWKQEQELEAYVDANEEAQSILTLTETDLLTPHHIARIIVTKYKGA